MRVLVQRSKESSVTVNGEVVGKIDKGLVVFSCFCEGDNQTDIDYIVRKLTNLRIFDDDNGVMNLSVIDTGGKILSISQFTLYADAKKGNRPSYIKALNGEESIKLYNTFNEKLREILPVETGKFGADMQVSILNDGPITIILDSKESI